MLRTSLLGLALAAALLAAPARALVHHDQGRRVIDGVQLLQAYEDPALYYYLPQSPRLATRDDGTLELLCLKYVDESGGTHGGLFHALVEFSLPLETVEQLAAKLTKESPGARLAGPVPLIVEGEDGDGASGSFQLVSGVLSDVGSEGFTRSVIASKSAPVTPGSRSVVAAILNQEGATLLWDSLQSPTSDVSVAVEAFYEAAVPSYNAVVTAEVETIYRHFSHVANAQAGYTKRQIRDGVDNLQRNGGLTIEVLDRSSGSGSTSSSLAGILQIVTDKLTQLMFDHQSGWSAEPEREAIVEQNQIKGRQKRGIMGRVFGGTKDAKYYTDDQWVLKQRRDIRRNRFVVNLSQATTIRVPLSTAGNLGGLHAELGEGSPYFRVVNLSDPAFEFHEIHVQVDGGYVEAFQDTVNFVTLDVRKEYAQQPAFTGTLHFTGADLEAGKTIKTVAFPRLGVEDAGWRNYEYRASWSLRDGPTVTVPGDDGWLSAGGPALALSAPFERSAVEIEAGSDLFASGEVSAVVVEFASFLAGEAKFRRKITLRENDGKPVRTIKLSHDPGRPLAYRLSWYGAGGEGQTVGALDDSYLYLTASSLLGAEAGP